METRRWKVGELARATGLTVRALHHFDEIGLLRPAERDGSGHRSYTPEDVRRLYRVLALRHLGMPLGEIASSLDGAAGDLAVAVRRQLDEVNRRLTAQRRLRNRLTALLRAKAQAREPTVEELLEAMQALMESSYFTPDQLTRLRQRHAEAGEAGFGEWKRRWFALAAEVQEHCERGTDVADPAVQELAERWHALMNAMTGGDRSVVSAMYAMMDGKGAETATKGVVRDEAWDYVKRAFAVGFTPVS